MRAFRLSHWSHGLQEYRLITMFVLVRHNRRSLGNFLIFSYNHAATGTILEKKERNDKRQTKEQKTATCNTPKTFSKTVPKHLCLKSMVAIYFLPMRLFMRSKSDVSFQWRPSHFKSGFSKSSLLLMLSFLLSFCLLL